MYLYRAVDQFGQVIHRFASTRGDRETARRLVRHARATTGVVPAEVITDRAPTYPRVLDEVLPTAWHHSEQYANNRIEADHAQLKRRSRCTMRSDAISTGHLAGRVPRVPFPALPTRPHRVCGAALCRSGPTRTASGR